MNKLFYQCPDLDTFKTLKFAADRNNTEYITYTDSSVSVYGTPDIKWNQICFVLDDENPFIYINGRIIYDSEDILTKINNLTILSPNYEMSSYSNSYLSLEAGDTYDKAFGKLEKAIIDNEFAISTALTDLDNRITIVNWEEDDPTSYAFIQNKPDLSNFLTIETQANWNETNTSSAAYIQNKPEIPVLVQPDWNETTTTSLDYIKNKPNIYNNLGLYIRDNSSIEISTTHQSIIFDDAGGESISIIGDEEINLDADKVYYNSKEVATKNDIPTVPTTSTTVTENDTNPVSGGAVYNKFENLIGTAPAALDTLGEIATALNNDANLAATLTNQISSKIPKVSNPTTNNFASFNSDGTIKDSSYSASSFITSIKTVNNESLVGTGNLVVSGLPQVSASDNGKILMVVNGQWQLVSPAVLYSGNGVPNNANGNNGDLFMQTD